MLCLLGSVLAKEPQIPICPQLVGHRPDTKHEAGPNTDEERNEFCRYSS